MIEQMHHSALLSDIGKKRTANQDRGLINADLNLFMVADGMGGHQGGETASQLCIDVVERVFKEQRTNLMKGAHQANLEVFQLSQTRPELAGMGTTLTALCITGNDATVVHVGDSRAYFFNSESLWQITEDHSVVFHKLKAGLITAKEAKIDADRGVITRCVGFSPKLEVDQIQFKIQPGDGILLCSDGLTGFLDDQEIFDTLKADKNPDPKDTVEHLVRKANERGGNDNITALIVNIR